MFARLRWRIAQYLEVRWWRYYLRKSSPAEYLNNKTAYWERLLNEIGYYPTPGANVLDAGCGPAGVFIYLHHLQSVTAVDPLLSQYASYLPVFNIREYPSVNFVITPLETANLPLAPFDTIYCFNAINHI
ncbi:MAG: class I SAM-dependent methyltransferase, partial [Bacteroidota bacterium]